jgi:hypothetical protein
MTAKSLGTWRAYRPTQLPASMMPPQPKSDSDLATPSPGVLNQLFVSTLFMRNAEGQDWYDFSRELPQDVTYVLTDEDGEVRSASNDPTALVPKDMELFQLDKRFSDLSKLYFRKVSDL